jgi:hypothetical protein
MPKQNNKRVTAPTTLALTIDEFCHAHRMSSEMYFKMRRQGLGRREMQVGRRRVISLESAAAWRAAREAASQNDAA